MRLCAFTKVIIVAHLKIAGDRAADQHKYGQKKSCPPPATDAVPPNVQSLPPDEYLRDELVIAAG